MHSKDFLASELRKAGLVDLAKRASAGAFHDFLSQDPFPSLRLDQELERIGTPEALELRRRHDEGEFDATVEEGEEWEQQSAEGQHAIAVMSETWH